MRFETTSEIHKMDRSFVGYKLVAQDLDLNLVLIREDYSTTEIAFRSVQSFSFVPDDLSNYRDGITLDAFQRAVDKCWIDELRVPSDIHRKYLEDHSFYVVHATDVGQFEIVAVSSEIKEISPS